MSSMAAALVVWSVELYRNCLMFSCLSMFRMRYITICDVLSRILNETSSFSQCTKISHKIWANTCYCMFFFERLQPWRDSTFRLAPSNLFALHRNTTSDLGRLGSYLSTETFFGRVLQMQFYQFYDSVLLIYRLWRLSIDRLWSHLCCERRRTEVAIRAFDLAPTGFISRCPWSTGFVRPSTPNISNTKLDSFLCSASWLRVT